MNCLYPKCGNQHYARGLCLSHYQAALRLISQKKTTWAKLEKAGKVNPSRVRTISSDWLLN